MNTLLEKKPWLGWVLGILALFVVVLIVQGDNFLIDFFRGQADESEILVGDAPPAIACEMTFNNGTTVVVRATGGTDDKPFTWYAPDSTTIRGTGRQFVVGPYATEGVKSVIVVHGDPESTTVPTRTARCQFTVEQGVISQ